MGRVWECIVKNRYRKRCSSLLFDGVWRLTGSNDKQKGEAETSVSELTYKSSLSSLYSVVSRVLFYRLDQTTHNTRSKYFVRLYNGCCFDRIQSVSASVFPAVCGHFWHFCREVVLRSTVLQSLLFTLLNLYVHLFWNPCIEFNFKRDLVQTWRISYH